MQRVKYAVLHTSLKANRSYCAKLARVVHDELVGLKAITYPDDTKADAESLIKLNAGQEAHLRTCAKAKTFAAWKAAYDRSVKLDNKAMEPTNLIGLHLDIPSVALLTAGLGCYLGGESPVTAQLVADAAHGTTFNGRPVVWPLGFTGRRAGSEVEVLDAAGNVRATTGRRYWIAQAHLSPHDGTSDRFPAAVDCSYPWDFGQCDAHDEPALPAGITAHDHEESRAAHC